MTISVAPYPTLSGDVTLTIRQAWLDDNPLHISYISSQEHVVALHRVEKAAWTDARLAVTVELPDAELERGRADWLDIACHVVVSERRTCLRRAVPLSRGADGRWTGVVELHRDEHLNRADLEAVVTAQVAGVPGRVIGACVEPWTADFVSRSPTRQRSVPARWVDFTAEENGYLNAYRNAPWAIDSGGVEPIVYLNSGFEGLKALLGGSTGTRADREAVVSQIATQVWTALFNTAAVGSVSDERTAEWPGGWQESVLRRMLPDVYPDTAPRDGLDELSRQISEGDGDLQARVLNAALIQARIPRALTTFIRDRASAHEDAEKDR
jgi:hypothetical protein